MSWTPRALRRLLVDMHVPDWDPQLMGRFDPEHYVEVIAEAGVQSLMQYANSHVGLALWRSAIVPTHRAMGERDWFGEVVDACRRRGISVVAYFSVIYDNQAYQAHPDWRILPVDGIVGPPGRYGTVCLNSPYRDYARAAIQELLRTHPVAGVFFDMTFWPTVCYCPHCLLRYREETAAEPPTVVDWHDPSWRRWQATRERWLEEFGVSLTAAVREIGPDLTVNHQLSTVFLDWRYAVPFRLAAACDYVGGDFYGGPRQHSLACKVFGSLSRSRPFEYHTSLTVGLGDHVTVKPAAQLRAEAWVASAHGAALLTIDAIGPDGTLNGDLYRSLADLHAERAGLEEYLGGDVCGDVALYYDDHSRYDPEDSGPLATGRSGEMPHLAAVSGAARVLQQAHITFGVVTGETLAQLSRYRALWLPDLFELTAGEAEAVAEFVDGGGRLVVTGRSGVGQPGWERLAEVLGLADVDAAPNRYGFLRPADPTWRAAIRPQRYLAVSGVRVIGIPTPAAVVRARSVGPFVDPDIGDRSNSRFASIHSNPPALTADAGALAVDHRFGRGRAVWIGAAIECRKDAAVERLWSAILGDLLPETDRLVSGRLRPQLEVVVRHEPARRRIVVGLVDVAETAPSAAPGGRLCLSVGALGVEGVRAVRAEPTGASVAWQERDGAVACELGAIAEGMLLVVEY